MKYVDSESIKMPFLKLKAYKQIERYHEQFDLNIEKILENWEAFHAIREIIANALDEQLITNTKEVKY